MSDLISREGAINAIYHHFPNMTMGECANVLHEVPPAEPKEVIPHRNYKYLSDYWCECGWHLGKKGEVKYCSECGRKVNWSE